MNLVERLRDVRYTGEDSRTEAADEIERLQAENDALRMTLAQIKHMVCGEALPYWENTLRTGASRGVIADIVDAALEKTK